MADTLGASTWTAFTKKQKLDLDDAAFVKALTRYDKTGDKDPEARLEALEGVVEQARKLVAALAKQKKELGDKAFNEAKAKVYELHDEAEAMQKKVRADVEAAAGDDEDESPALLSTKMIPLLRELRKGESRMSALVCTAGKNTAVLIMRRSISNSRRKLLSEAVDAAGGAKFIAAECVFENGALTFVVQSQAAGLAKRLRAALLQQTAMRLKVRVRGEDGAEDQDGEDEESAQQDKVEGTGQGDAGEVPEPPSPEAVVYASRLLQLKDRLAEALRAQHPESTKLRALMAFASEKADEKGDHAGAIKALEMLEKLLGAPASTGQPPKDKTLDPGPAFTARLAALMPRVKEALGAGGPAAQDIKLKTSEAGTLARKQDHAAAHRLLDEVEALLGGDAGGRPQGGDESPPSEDAMVVWQRARTAAVTVLKAVAAKIAAARHAESAKAVIEIQAVVKNLSAGPLSLQQVAELQRYLGEDDVVHDVCELAEDIRTPLLQALQRVKEQISA